MNSRLVMIKKIFFFVSVLMLSLIFFTDTVRADNLRISKEWAAKAARLAESGNLTDAVKAYSKAIELNPHNAVLYFNRGYAYGDLGNYQQEIKDYSKAIELNPQDGEAYFNRGVAYHKLGNTQQKINDFKIAARLGIERAQDFLTSKGIEW